MSFPRYPKYKDSGVEWLGEVPEHWDAQPIKTVASCNDDVLTESTPDDFEIEYVEISGVQEGRGIIESSVIPFREAPSRARRIVQDGDVIVSTVRTYLRAISPVRNPSDNMIVSTGFAVIRPRAVDSHFLGYLFLAEYLIGKVISHSVGVSYPAINASDLMRFDVPLPPLPEQTTIATFLDHETAKIDTLITEQERLIALLAEKRQAVISHAVTKGLDPNVPMKDSGVEWLGEVPVEWEVVPAKRVASVFVPQRNKPDLNTNGDGHFWVTMEHMRSEEINSAEMSVAESAAKNAGTRVLPSGAIIASCVGTFGLAAINNVDVIINQQLQAFIPTNRVDSKFMRQCVVIAEGYFEQIGTAATIAYVNQLGFENMPMVLPPKVEQLKIVEFLALESVKFDNLTTEARRAINLLKERRSALISAAVTGKIDVRGLIDKEAAA